MLARALAKARSATLAGFARNTASRASPEAGCAGDMRAAKSGASLMMAVNASFQDWDCVSASV